MNRDGVNDVCRDLPGAEWSDPWGGGHDAWKVGGKMFACIGMANDGVSLKTPDTETASLLIEMGRAERAPYFHKSWVRLPWGHVADPEFRERILTSYRIVRSGLPKKVQAGLGPVPEA
ncbi:MAG: MmcQ/YjbR family DNA-binding protein [Pseudomonadota bacterium]